MISLTLDCAEIISGRIKVTLTSKVPLSGPMAIEALRCDDENFIQSLTINDLAVQNPIKPISIPSYPLVLEYEVISRFEEFVGSHVDLNLNYPFFNSSEAYIGSGVLPVIEGYERVEGSIGYELSIVHVPEGWKVSTSLLSGESHAERIPMEKAAQFYFYTSRSAKHLSHDGMRIVLGEKTKIPFSSTQLVDFCRNSIQTHERVFGRNEHARVASLLILQSPPNFDEVTRKKTFSTGENYTGGIAIYGPDRVDLLKKLGHPTYLDFILGGIHHEIGHAYTSAGPARFKSILYASADCPQDDRFLIGERLNGYFNAATRATFDTQFNFSLNQFVSNLFLQVVNGKRLFELDLFLFDLALRAEARVSLRHVFQAMLDEKRQMPGPFHSADFLIHTVELLIGRKVPARIRNLLLEPEPSNYEKLLLAGLSSNGWSKESLPTDRESAIQFFIGSVEK